MSSDLRSELQSEATEVEVFNGTARDAVNLFPSNANIAAAISICGLGFDETNVILVAKPNTTKTRHLINIGSRIGVYQLEFVNEVSAANPKSSQLAAYSVLAELVRLASTGNFFEKSERKR
jgi:aspartate dehydrogenase